MSTNTDTQAVPAPWQPPAQLPVSRETERLVLEYADAITITDRDVSDELFARIRARFDEDAIVELTEIVAWENASSKFNRALRVPSQGLWKRDSRT